jgi:hypothetical protein
MIRNQVGSEVLKIITDDWERARRVLQDQPGVQEVQSYGEALHVLVDHSEKRMSQYRKILRKQDISITEMRPIAPRMEEAFISLIRKMDQAG